ncbi:DUF262 domain-containing protein [Nocardiopsis mangrovi]|uniref:DUF262 domain-containing protein n=1 Tax=Nocardiopsis mangrovi TaxID=1179818 RepID=A0ABV9DXZ6_9ACTN
MKGRSALAVHTFESTNEFLDELLRQLADERIQLPDFQRGWVWSQPGISGLLASISLGFSVGTLMLLRTGGDARLRHRPIEGAETTAAHGAEQLLLDGQQRMTSLFQALKLGTPAHHAGRARARPQRLVLHRPRGRCGHGGGSRGGHQVRPRNIRRRQRGPVCEVTSQDSNASKRRKG